MAEQDHLTPWRWTPESEAFYRWAIDRLRLHGVRGAVADVGCGSGMGTKMLLQAGFAAFGIEEDREAVEAAKANGVRARHMRYERKLREPFRWEATVAGNLLGYYDDPEVFLQDLRRDSRRVTLIGTDHPGMTPDFLLRAEPGAAVRTAGSWVMAEILRSADP